MRVPIGRNLRTDNILQKSSNVAEYNNTQKTKYNHFDYEMTQNTQNRSTHKIC